MTTVYDIVSVVLFLCLVAAFLILTDRQPGTVSRLLVSGVTIAVGNQLGNAGQGLLAAALMAAGCVTPSSSSTPIPPPKREKAHRNQASVHRELRKVDLYVLDATAQGLDAASQPNRECFAVDGPSKLRP